MNTDNSIDLFYHIYNRFRYDKSFEWNCMFANSLFSTISLSMRLRMSRCVLFQVYFFSIIIFVGTVVGFTTTYVINTYHH
jgi:hypothetical protein